MSDPPKLAQTRPPSREEIWDGFVDALDRAGQAGSAAGVLTPADLHPELRNGVRFGDLVRDDIETLVRIASSIGRRGDIVKQIWEQTQQQLKAEKRKPR